MTIFCFHLQESLHLSPMEVDSLRLTSKTACLSQWMPNLPEKSVHSFLKMIVFIFGGGT